MIGRLIIGRYLIFEKLAEKLAIELVGFGKYLLVGVWIDFYFESLEIFLKTVSIFHQE